MQCLDLTFSLTPFFSSSSAHFSSSSANSSFSSSFPHQPPLLSSITLPSQNNTPLSAVNSWLPIHHCTVFRPFTTQILVLYLSLPFSLISISGPASLLLLALFRCSLLYGYSSRLRFYRICLPILLIFNSFFFLFCFLSSFRTWLRFCVSPPIVHLYGYLGESS